MKIQKKNFGRGGSGSGVRVGGGGGVRMDVNGTIEVFVKIFNCSVHIHPSKIEVFVKIDTEDFRFDNGGETEFKFSWLKKAE